jgi:uncharacterized protein (TIGR00725 family)
MASAPRKHRPARANSEGSRTATLALRAAWDDHRTVRERACIAVIGAGTCDADQAALAEEVGRLLGRAGALVVCGGLGGVMEAACRGAKAEGGTTLGLLPGTDRREANPWIDVAVPTGLGEARNALVVRAADALIAIGGEFGTLSEIGFALKTGKPVIGLGTWELPQRPAAIARASSAAEAVALALDRCG